MIKALKGLLSAKRNGMLFIVTVFGLTLTVSACESTHTEAESQKEPNQENTMDKKYEVTKSESEWKAVLSDEEYHVLREKGTERAFTGEFNDFKKEGTFTCAGCGNPLFTSETKYNSGSGWPSFYAPISKENVELDADQSFGMTRTEVLCNRCGGHLGHVFDDGPEPTGMRYCINSVSLDFEAKE